MTDFDQSEIGVCFPRKIFSILNKLPEDDQQKIEQFIEGIEKIYKAELKSLNERIKELEDLLIEKDKLMKEKEDLHRERTRDFQRKIRELKRVISAEFENPNALVVLNNLKVQFIEYQSNTISQWSNNRITDSKVNAEASFITKKFDQKRDITKNSQPKKQDRSSESMTNHSRTAFVRKRPRRRGATRIAFRHVRNFLYERGTLF